MVFGRDTVLFLVAVVLALGFVLLLLFLTVGEYLDCEKRLLLLFTDLFGLELPLLETPEVPEFPALTVGLAVMEPPEFLTPNLLLPSTTFLPIELYLLPTLTRFKVFLTSSFDFDWRLPFAFEFLSEVP